MRGEFTVTHQRLEHCKCTPEEAFASFLMDLYERQGIFKEWVTAYVYAIKEDAVMVRMIWRDWQESPPSMWYLRHLHKEGFRLLYV